MGRMVPTLSAKRHNSQTKHLFTKNISSHRNHRVKVIKKLCTINKIYFGRRITSRGEAIRPVNGANSLRVVLLPRTKLMTCKRMSKSILIIQLIYVVLSTTISQCHHNIALRKLTTTSIVRWRFRLYDNDVIHAADPAFPVLHLGLIIFGSGQRFVMTCLTVVRLRLCKPEGPATARGTGEQWVLAQHSAPRIQLAPGHDNVTADGAFSGAG